MLPTPGWIVVVAGSFGLAAAALTQHASSSSASAARSVVTTSTPGPALRATARPLAPTTRPSVAPTGFVSTRAPSATPRATKSAATRPSVTPHTPTANVPTELAARAVRVVLSRDAAAVNSPVDATAHAVPAAGGLRLTLQSYDNGTWKTVDTALTDSAGVARFRFTSDTAGAFRVRVVSAASGALAGGSSPVELVQFT